MTIFERACQENGSDSVRAKSLKGLFVFVFFWLFIWKKQNLETE